MFSYDFTKIESLAAVMKHECYGRFAARPLCGRPLAIEQPVRGGGYNSLGNTDVQQDHDQRVLLCAWPACVSHIWDVEYLLVPCGICRLHLQLRLC